MSGKFPSQQPSPSATWKPKTQITLLCILYRLIWPKDGSFSIIPLSVEHYDGELASSRTLFLCQTKYLLCPLTLLFLYWALKMRENQLLI